jgi:8-oxo-dGTP diphosphatase
MLERPIPADPADRPQVAIVILHRDHKLLLQLRENRPNIRYPGYWGLFGGHIEVGETPDAAIQRELLEEIGYLPPNLDKFGCYNDDRLIRHVYAAPLIVELTALTLRESWDMGLLTPQDIERGEHYSPIADEIRPMGNNHRQILLDFIGRNPTLFNAL